MSTRVQVPVRIMNRATPIFTQQVYSASVAENAPMHTTITSIEAHSPTGQKLIYSIMGGDPYNEFDVHFNTGKSGSYVWRCWDACGLSECMSSR